MAGSSRDAVSSASRGPHRGRGQVSDSQVRDVVVQRRAILVEEPSSSRKRLVDASLTGRGGPERVPARAATDR